MSRKGDLLWEAQHGPIEQRDHARRQLREMAQQEQQVETDGDDAARARRVLNISEPDPEPEAQGQVQRAGDAMYEHHYGTSRRWTGFGATE